MKLFLSEAGGAPLLHESCCSIISVIPAPSDLVSANLKDNVPLVCLPKTHPVISYRRRVKDFGIDSSNVLLCETKVLVRASSTADGIVNPIISCSTNGINDFSHALIAHEREKLFLQKTW